MNQFSITADKIDSKTAFLFPGQGSQSVGMGEQIYETSPKARSIFHEVDEALDRPLSKLIFNGPETELRDTINAQPGIMTVSLACMAAMTEQLSENALPYPSLVAGHSLGEYTALAVAGVLDTGTTAYLVQERGRLMQEACDRRPGTMAAILGLDHMTIEEISRETGTYVSNVNTEQQIVISGDSIAVARALDLASARGARRTIPLSVGGAFHSALMEPAREGLVDVIKGLEFKPPTVPIIANTTGEPLTKAEDVKQELIAQICGCVQWKQSIDYMIASGVTRFIEIGPGNSLTTMVKRISKTAQTVNIGDVESILTLSLN